MREPNHFDLIALVIFALIAMPVLYFKQVKERISTRGKTLAERDREMTQRRLMASTLTNLRVRD
jgi:hypothetical protein